MWINAFNRGNFFFFVTFVSPPFVLEARRMTSQSTALQEMPTPARAANKRASPPFYKVILSYPHIHSGTPDTDRGRRSETRDFLLILHLPKLRNASRCLRIQLQRKFKTLHWRGFIFYNDVDDFILCLKCAHVVYCVISIGVTSEII